jgi:hypothetical protein
MPIAPVDNRFLLDKLGRRREVAMP